MTTNTTSLIIKAVTANTTYLFIYVIIKVMITNITYPLS
jgi:hypothetical protein